MKEKSTNELDEILKNMKPENIDKYYKENKVYMANDDKSFSYIPLNKSPLSNIKKGLELDFSIVYIPLSKRLKFLLS